MQAKRLLAYGAIYFFWGGSFLAIREIVAVTPPFFAAGFRFLLAGLLLTLYGLRRAGAFPSGKQWKASALVGLIMSTGNYGCLFWAEKSVPSGMAAILSATIPVWILLGESVWLRLHPVTPLAIAGLVLGLAGVAILVEGGSGAGRPQVLPAVVLLLGTFCWTIGTLLGRKLPMPSTPALNAGLQMAFGGGFLLLGSFLLGDGRVVARLAGSMSWPLGLQLTFAMAYLIVCASILAFSAYIWLIGHEPASRVASYAYVNPMVAVLLGVLFAGERFTAMQGAGALLALAGVVATMAARKTKAA